MVFHITRSIDLFGLERSALKLVEDRAVGLAHDVGENAQPAPVRHADNDLIKAQGAPAFDDLLHRRDQRLAAIKAEALGAHVFDVQEFLEAFRLDHLVQDRLAPVLGELDFLAVSLDPFLQPTGLYRVGDVHVLQRKGAAVGAAHDVDDLAHRRHLQTQHVVDENRAVHVGVGKAVGLGIKLGVRGLIAHPQRVQIGHKMAPDPVGADDHQGANAVENGALDLIIGQFDLGLGGFGRDLLARFFRFFRRPFPRQRGGHLVTGNGRPILARPRGTLRLGGGGVGITERFEEVGPCRINRRGVAGVLGVKLLQIFRVVPLHEAGGMELVVGGLFGHCLVPRVRERDGTADGVSGVALANFRGRPFHDAARPGRGRTPSSGT